MAKILENFDVRCLMESQALLRAFTSRCPWCQPAKQHQAIDKWPMFR
jgi:hypothetical protein